MRLSAILEAISGNPAQRIPADQLEMFVRRRIQPDFSAEVTTEDGEDVQVFVNVTGGQVVPGQGMDAPSDEDARGGVEADYEVTGWARFVEDENGDWYEIHQGSPVLTPDSEQAIQDLAHDFVDQNQGRF